MNQKQNVKANAQRKQYVRPVIVKHGKVEAVTLTHNYNYSGGPVWPA